ncbi:MAG: hypothetical protein JO092_01680 [Candidatus Eremiobacteraeota bacterium]|nr:hypothetical protein [Candidatus Eremiobacteraeota bacterium]
MSHAVLNAVWRITLVVLLLASIPLYVCEFTLYSKEGDPGFFTDYNYADAPGLTEHVTAVATGSQAWREGIRVGDAIPLAAMDREDRIALTWPVAGDHLRLTYLRGGVSRRVEVVARANGSLLPEYLVEVVIQISISSCLFVFALLVIARAWKSEYGPVIATILTGLVVGAAANLWGVTAFPLVARLGAAAALNVLAKELGLMQIFSAVMLMVLLGQIVGRRGRLLRALTWFSALMFAAAAIGTLVALTLSLTGRAGLPTEYASHPTYLFWASFFIGIVGLFVALYTARGESRQRVRWLVWGFAPYLAAYLLHDALYFFAPPSNFAHAYYSAAFLVELALPVTLIYGVLYRRVVDVGFVINRVAVYGALSIVLVSIFILLEYAVSKLFLDTTRAGSLTIQFGIALVIGLSAHYLHRIVDRFVDRIFFAKRHADESALRRFAREAEAYASSEVLLDRAIGVLSEHSDARGIAIYVTKNGVVEAARASDPAFPADIDLDDPLLVKLRRWNEPVDTHDVVTAFPDGMVFPMSVRGKLVGALACEAKRDATAFDPDERESLGEVARSAGAALDLLSNRGDDTTLVLQQSIAALSEAVASFGKKFDSLSDKLAGEDRIRTAG